MTASSLVGRWSDHAAVLVVAGSVVFMIGASVGVPTVFMTAATGDRLRLLTEHLVRWRMAQVPYAIGPIMAAAGVAAPGIDGSQAVKVFRLAAGWAMLVGAVAWSYVCYLRAVDPVAFAGGHQPGWPFRLYVILTIIGLAVLGAALVASGRTVLASLTLLADLGYLILYLATADIAPYVFYVLLLIVGVSL